MLRFLNLSTNMLGVVKKCASPLPCHKNMGTLCTEMIGLEYRGRTLEPWQITDAVSVKRETSAAALFRKAQQQTPLL